MPQTSQDAAGGAARGAFGRTAFVGRQPIFTRKQAVFGYELLFRSGQDNANLAGQGDELSTTVMHDVLTVIGLDRLTAGKKAFVNLTRHLLLDEFYTVMPKETAVIELLENVLPDGDVLVACRKLKAAGYTLALDDLVSTNGLEPLLELADIIKVDFRGTTRAERESLRRRLAPHRALVLAEKVETREEFAQAAGQGHAYFQGYFFSKPQIVAAEEVPVVNHRLLQMLVEVSRPETDFDRLEQLIKTDVSLCTKLLRYINSAAMGVRTQILSVKQALLLLGTRPLKKWATLVCLTKIGSERPAEVMVISLTRAAFCERIADRLGLTGRQFDLFMMGMLSTLDVLMGRPLAEVLGPIPLAEDAKATLLGERTALSDAYELALACERVDRPRIDELARCSGLDLLTVANIHRDAMLWADEAGRA